MSHVGPEESFVLLDPSRTLAKQPHELTEDEKLKPHAPQVVVVMGTQGAGKSAVAGRLGEKLGANVLRTDEIRNNLFGGQPREIKYAPQAKDRVYQKMFHRAALISEKVPVIVDATFWKQSRRDDLINIVHEHNSNTPIQFVEVVAPDMVANERVDRKLADPDDASEAHLGIARRDRARWEPVGSPRIVINNSTNDLPKLHALVDQIVKTDI